MRTCSRETADRMSRRLGKVEEEGMPRTMQRTLDWRAEEASHGIGRTGWAGEYGRKWGTLGVGGRLNIG